MLEILFLLLPIAAAYGWYMGNRSAQQDKQKHSNQISRQYVTGLNLLLSDQSDKAVDHFIELLQVDNDTIDTHLALGNLFRSRGEVDRAIRIHQNLISRSGLTIDQKNIALQGTSQALEAFIEYTRTGLIDNVPGSILGATQANRPRRLLYPTSEYTSNAANVPAQGNVFATGSFWFVY